MDASTNLARNLAMLRSLRGASLICFAQELGISKSTLQQIEQGHSPTLDTVECIAERLGVSAAALLSDSPSPAQTELLAQVLQGLDWYDHWSPEDQAFFRNLLTQLLYLFSKYHPSS